MFPPKPALNTATNPPSQSSASHRGRHKKHRLPARPPKQQYVVKPTSKPAAAVEAAQDTTIGCEICCSTDVASDNVTMCSSGHIFCKDCARRMAESQLGLRRSAMPCMSMKGCSSSFEEAEIKEFLPPATFRLWERIRAEEEIKAAGLEGIEHCPFCDFAIVIDNKEEKLFRCFNDECSRLSCRNCKREDHIPKSCLEHDIDLRERSVHEAEEQLSAVLMRRCPQVKCNTPMIKEETIKSCNRMTCAVCKKDMCYCCRKDVSVEGYRHFDMESDGTKTGRCPLWEDSMERHKRDIEEAKIMMGVIAPRKTEAEQQDEMRRRKLFRQQQGVDMFDLHFAIYDIPGEDRSVLMNEQELRQYEAHNNVMAEKRHRQEQLKEAMFQQKEVDLGNRFEALRQREERLNVLGFGTFDTLGPFKLGDPIHLRLEEKELTPALSPSPSRSLALQSKCSSQHQSSPANQSSLSKLKAKSSPPILMKSSEPSSSLSMPPSNPSPSRRIHCGPLQQAASRAPRHSEP